MESVGRRIRTVASDEREMGPLSSLSKAIRNQKPYPWQVIPLFELLRQLRAQLAERLAMPVNLSNRDRSIEGEEDELARAALRAPAPALTGPGDGAILEPLRKAASVLAMRKDYVLRAEQVMRLLESTSPARPRRPRACVRARARR